VTLTRRGVCPLLLVPVLSQERVAPPGEVDNSWLLNPYEDYRPFPGLSERTGQTGHYARVTPEVWQILMEAYGGGPSIW
jgi:hypothetical protein